MYWQVNLWLNIITCFNDITQIFNLWTIIPHLVRHSLPSVHTGPYARPFPPPKLRKSFMGAPKRNYGNVKNIIHMIFTYIFKDFSLPLLMEGCFCMTRGGVVECTSYLCFVTFISKDSNLHINIIQDISNHLAKSTWLYLLNYVCGVISNMTISNTSSWPNEYPRPQKRKKLC